MKQANKANAKFVLIIGENELEQGQAVLKNMATQEQKDIPIDSLPDKLIKILSPNNKFTLTNESTDGSRSIVLNQEKS